MDIKNLASIQEQLGMSPGTSNLKLYKLFLSEIVNKHTAIQLITQQLKSIDTGMQTQLGVAALWDQMLLRFVE